MLDALEVVGPWQVFLDFLAHQREGHRIPLEQDHMGETGRQDFRIVEFCQLARAIIHGGTAVHDQMGYEVGILFILADIISFGAAENLPVEMADVIAGRVFAVLCKLDGKPVIGRAVFPDPIALDDFAGHESERIAAGNGIRIQQFRVHISGFSPERGRSRRRE